MYKNYTTLLYFAIVTSLVKLICLDLSVKAYNSYSYCCWDICDTIQFAIQLKVKSNSSRCIWSHELNAGVN